MPSWDEIAAPYKRRLHEPGATALYLHIPFCARKCAYCDFTSRATAAGDPRMPQYVDDLIDQIKHCAAAGLLEDTRTAYIGGGTPSLLGTKLVRLVDAVREVCPHLVEFTSEANPDSLSAELLNALEEAGLTRISMGVQSTCDDELAALGRTHDAQTALVRLQEAVASGLDVSCDLMCAIPHQTDESWEKSLTDVLSCGNNGGSSSKHVSANPTSFNAPGAKCASSNGSLVHGEHFFGVDHISVYPLQIEEGTPLAREVGESDPIWNSTDIQADRMEAAYQTLSAAGYEHYEVASYARPGKRCLHNIAYWSGQTYLGLGRSAASMLTSEAYMRLREAFPWLPQLPDQAFRIRLKWINNHQPKVELEILTEPQAVAEDLMLAMRTSDGIRRDQFAYAGDVLGKDKLDDCFDRLAQRGLVYMMEDGVRPTHQGWLLGNELYEALWDLAPSQETKFVEARA